MTWLYILLGILLFILLLLLIPIGIRARFDEELRAVLKIGFIPITLYPQKPKKPKKKKKKSTQRKEPKKEKPKEKKPSVIKEKGIVWLINTIREAAELAVGALRDFFKHLVIKRLNISISYCGEDAEDTAVKYGYFCLSVYPAVSMLVSVAKCKHYGVDISPDFDEKHESRYAVDIFAKIRLFWIFALVFRHGFKALKLLFSLKNEKNSNKENKELIEMKNKYKGDSAMEHPIGNLMNITMEKIKEMVDVNTIVGDPITAADGTLIIPVSKVSYGFASGGSDLPTKKESKDCFGGGSGAGVTIQPIAFLTVYQGNVRLISVGGGDGMDKILGMVPDVVDKVKSFFKKDKKTEITVSDDFSEITVDDVDI